MGTLALLVFLLLAAQAKKTPRATGFTPEPAGDVHTAAHHARRHAAKAAQHAAQVPTPANQHAATQAAQAATVLTNASAAQTAKAKATPPPWPAAAPSGLAQWPSGWEFDNPPPQAVVTRANQLIPTLWARGAGTRTVEMTAGRWISYVASPMGKLRGVVAYRQKARANA